MIERKVYLLLLHLHPASFRARFAEEMLWIFDQTVENAGPSQLLTDAAISLLKQHMAMDTAPRLAGRLFQAAPSDTFHAVRFLQAGAVASIMLIGFLALLGEPVPPPHPPRSIAIRKYLPDVCGGMSFGVRRSDRRQGARKQHSPGSQAAHETRFLP